MEIFKYDNFEFELVEPTVLLIKEFNEILKKDKTKTKEKSFNLFKFIYLMYDWKSPNIDLEASIMNKGLNFDEEGFKLYLKELDVANKQLKDKSKSIGIFTDPRTIQSLLDCKLTVEDLDEFSIFNALRRYRKIQDNDLEIVMINAMRNSFHKYKKYFEEVDFQEKVEAGPRKGSLVYSTNDYRNAVGKADELFASLDKLEKRVKDKKKKEGSNRRGNEDEPGLKY